MGYLRPKSGLRKKNVYFGVESKMETKHEFHLDLRTDVLSGNMWKFVV